MIHISEDILHFIWKNNLFDQDELKTTEELPLQIIHKGHHNHHSGPDFSEAKIKIGDTVWAGNVEIHVRSSDWYLHHHQTDEAYNNVILHIVYFDDKPVYVNNQKLPVLVLNNRVKPILFSKYKNLLKNENELACGKMMREIPEILIQSQLERSVSERLIRKSNQFLQMMDLCKNDWNEIILRFLVKCMLGKTNELPAEWLMKEISFKMIQETGFSIFKKEALLLGMAGFLEQPSDDYSKKLHDEFLHLKNKYNLTPMNSVAWKFGKIRPSQFPAYRLAQTAAILSEKVFLFSDLVSLPNENIIEMFSDLKASEYWETHYNLGKQTGTHSSFIGTSQQNLLIINWAAPALFAYGQYVDEYLYKEKAMDLLSLIQAENNLITRRFEKCGLPLKNAFDSQAVIELHNELCVRKKCLSCIIGTRILKHDSEN